MKFLILLASVLAHAQLTLAQDSSRSFDEVTFGETTYAKAKITRINGDSVTLLHSSGIAKIPVDQLPEDLAKELGFTNKKVEEFRVEEGEKKLLEARKKFAEQYLKENALQTRAKILQVLENGILIEWATHTDGTKREVKTERTVQTGSTSALSSGGSKPVYGTKTETKWVLNKGRIGLSFIECDAEGFVDGDMWEGLILRGGTYSYTNLSSARKTIPKYTAHVAEIAFRLSKEAVPK